MTGAGIREQQRRALAGVLTAWLAAASEDPQPSRGMHQLLAQFLEAEPDAVADDIRTYPLEEGASVDLPRSSGVMRGPPLDKEFPMHPVARMRLAVRDDGALAVCLRVALFYEHPEADVHGCVGWRFETAEDDNQPHPFLHAQSITTWNGSASLFSPYPEAQGSAYNYPDIARVNERRPAFPLPGRSPPALAAAMLASFYGAHRAAEWVSTGLVGQALRTAVKHEVAPFLPRVR